ncbi:hypothetical protein P153DRAFT_381724 [Dothidotthia symphoricarpi CBS 119687]|uniref:Uncharacterized protein n=1 Tax=Dothidotthia symphoricarpi CBS 119687 TaxID=1392245 RepID=A0A6A6AP25_9PLEO|nr:uncharacterized protein P153DRAFT_381724 [Dothidotthia symphoricarpi CBS 119687]KAF2133286.1 hypothetical protein P153DRAFT_381724 [Dothidotthia symphoricarpi CBS 119687]
MGNAESREAALTSVATNAFKAIVAIEKARLRAKARFQKEDADTDDEETASLLGDEQEPEITPYQQMDEEADVASSLASSSSSSSSSSRSSTPDQRSQDSIRNPYTARIPGNIANSSRNSYAEDHFMRAFQAWITKSAEAFDDAIAALRKMNFVEVAKAAGAWVKEHPWETAAIVIPLILLACTPAFLTAAGFTAGGIAAGSIAAGIQAGIGSVAAGSTFAILTSAGMAGFGVPIVLGGVWLTSSAICWGAVSIWKKFVGRGDGPADDDEDDDGAAAAPMILA